MPDTRAGMRRYSVTYPSKGRLPDFTGRFHLLMDPRTGPMPTIELPDGTMCVLDARAVITYADDGAGVYTPRSVPLDEHTGVMRRWLTRHPRWGAAIHCGGP